MPNNITRQTLLFLHLLALAPLSRSQNVATITAHTSPTTMSGGPFTAASGSVVFAGASATPSATDNAPGGSQHSNQSNSGIINYYFVFIALILCVVGAFIFFILRRRRRMLVRALYPTDQIVVERRRYQQGRWRSAEISREEGLNEQGEAPPPYVPKSHTEERDGQEALSVPLQSLSREGAGLKPPDYSETHAVEGTYRRDSAGSSSAAAPPRTPDMRSGP